MVRHAVKINQSINQLVLVVEIYEYVIFLLIQKLNVH